MMTVRTIWNHKPYQNDRRWWKLHVLTGPDFRIGVAFQRSSLDTTVTFSMPGVGLSLWWMKVRERSRG